MKEKQIKENWVDDLAELWKILLLRYPQILQKKVTADKSHRTHSHLSKELSLHEDRKTSPKEEVAGGRDLN